MQCQAKSKRSGEQCKKSAALGKKVCHIHGGKTKGGIAASKFKTGRYSKYIPKNLANKYHEAISDPEPLSLTEDVHLLRTLAFEHLNKMGMGDTHPAWIEVKAVYDDIKSSWGAKDQDGVRLGLVKLGKLIEPNYLATLAESKVSQYIDQLGRISDKERRLLNDQQKTMTLEQCMTLLTYVVLSVRESVVANCDRDTAQIILSDTQAAYDRHTVGMLPDPAAA